jgi:hypothetical protein
MLLKLERNCVLTSTSVLWAGEMLLAVYWLYEMAWQLAQIEACMQRYLTVTDLSSFKNIIENQPR